MKSVISFFLLLLLSMSAYANHLKGGWIQYEYLGENQTTHDLIYRITVRQYLDCASTPAQRDATVILGIFGSGYFKRVEIPLSGSDKPDKTTYSPCLSSPPPVCYYIDRYTTTVELPKSAAGYDLSVQRCCRIDGIVNVQGKSSDIGVTYNNKIPGTIGGADYSNNTSPVFAQKDTAIVCYNSPFTFDFSATDVDGDELVYYFCSGLIGGSTAAGNNKPDPPSAPPYTMVSYSTTFSGSSPLGSTVTIDPHTGIISGVAPSITGDYIVAVCAYEYRNGVNIGITKKEIHVKVANCSISAATLKPTYTSCNGTVLTFQNESTNSTITSYLWDFGVPGITTDISTDPTPSFDFSLSGKDSGSYTIKLVVANAGGCKDSATSLVKVYPGFVPKFGINGSCFQNPYKFIDSTTSRYGLVNSWFWNFGDVSTLADTAHSKDSSWKYPSASSVTVKLIVGDSRGCIDSLIKTLVIPDKPSVFLSFRDTLICSNDSLLLKAKVDSGTIVMWTPQAGPNQTRINNANSPTPVVFPKDTTLYKISINNSGCINTDSVQVNVLQFISVNLGADTGICKADSFQLRPISYALSYIWSSSSGEVVQNVKYPLVKPLVNTDYVVLANLGKCQASDSLHVAVAPYPTAIAGADTIICFGSRAQLNALITGSSFYWTPTLSLSNQHALNPLAAPSRTTSYVLYVFDTLGCPKPAIDTIIVNVIPLINAFAGNDTTILPNVPLQLNATGGDHYRWTPGTDLSSNDISNPIAKLDANVDSVTYRVYVSVSSCVASDDITIRVYKHGPDILVPSGFTPNGDGKNDVARPITIGISKLNYFTIYNRWGEPIFTTTENGKGWDGVYKGVLENSGTYVYKAEGIDYLGNTIFRKGTLVLIR